MFWLKGIVTITFKHLPATFPNKYNTTTNITNSHKERNTEELLLILETVLHLVKDNAMEKSKIGTEITLYRP